jgi:hypothetical protein
MSRPTLPPTRPTSLQAFQDLAAHILSHPAEGLAGYELEAWAIRHGLKLDTLGAWVDALLKAQVAHLRTSNGKPRIYPTL